MTRRIVPRRLLIGLAAVALLAVVGVAARQLVHPRHHAGQAQASYYCPMHPTYTSDRPGDCPICNMKLVKRETASVSTQQTAHSRQQTKDLKDICYLHNCPMVQQGKPCPMLVVAKQGESVTCPVCGTHIAGGSKPSRAKRVLYWTDPMIPGYRSDKPGTSPMGMELVPVYEEESAEASAGGIAPGGYAPILVSPQKRQLIGVTTAPVTRRTLTKTIRTVGRIAYDPELYQAEQEYLQALNGLLRAHAVTNPEVAAQAAQLLESARLRLRLLGLSDELIQEMTSWQQPDARLLLRDPSGQVWVYASIYEYELPLIHAGQTVTVDVPAIPSSVFEGTIRSMDSVLDPMTRTARIRAVLTDPDHLLKPEMFVNASVTVTLEEALAVPDAAVFDTGTKRIVFVDQGEGVFAPREVTIGVKADGWADVTMGLAEGDMVVTSGNFLIDSESRLKAALEGATPEGHQHGQ